MLRPLPASIFPHMTPPELYQRAVGPHETPDRSIPQEAAARRELELTVNGEKLAAPRDSTVADLLERLGLDPRTVVVEHNGAILRERAAAASCRLRANDVLEIVHFVGGG
jgi:sulfur carrier protein